MGYAYSQTCPPGYIFQIKIVRHIVNIRFMNGCFNVLLKD